MGKVMVEGWAEQLFDADVCDLHIYIEIERDTAAEASKESSTECERLLVKLKELGIEPSDIIITCDSIRESTHYDDKKTYYESRKYLYLRTSADVPLINAVRDIIETGFKKITMQAIFTVSNMEELRKALYKNAIEESRAKADFLAESVGLRIIGVDSANLTGKEDVYDLTEDKEDESDKIMRRSADIGNNDHPLTDLLTPETVKLRAKVKIVWLLSDAV